ncbi:hypothetical protein SAMN05216404_101356 [Nitrosospira multiformis]|uniref:Cyclic nucleotide-binding domain-containing protein n=1 Tax=Nitrosospira multiformis TaxID=1231 RepID=A0A1H8BUU0_9PROT|nr:Crp/Fnr family transcriptional regulator [Nitrosospira multiformis]SEM86543.1 hypothetical protein SAMN05216404_101356 [Nitrosospira multiformis]
MSHILTPTQNLSHRQNLLLAALPQKDYERLQPSLELVALSQGWSVYENGGELDLVYFPTSSVISLLTVSDKGETVKIAAIGKEGVFGISMLMGRKIAPTQALVATAGYAYRLSAASLRSEFELGSPLRYLLQRYTHALTSGFIHSPMPGAAHPSTRRGTPAKAPSTPAAGVSPRIFTHSSPDDPPCRLPSRSAHTPGHSL